MTEPPKPPKSAANLYERIRALVEPVGGIDLEPPPREPGRDRHWLAFDQTLAEVRSKFADMPTEELEALIGEAVVAVRAAKPRASAAGQAQAQEPGHMRHEDFRIGETFWCGDRQWRCTDIGTRVITAIRLDRVDVGSTAPEQRRTLGRDAAETEGWFNGPPYAANEVVFDEYDIEGCTLEAVADDADTSLGASGSAVAEDAWDSPEGKAKRIAHAHALREQARAGGLRFDAYLPPSLADWLLAHIERGTFRDPSEAVFVMLGEQQELEPHADLRREFFNRRIQAGIDSGPGIPAEEVFERLRKKLEEPLPEPAVWRGLP